MSDRKGAVPGAAGSAEVVDAPVRGQEQENVGMRERAKERRLAERGDRILDALATLIARWGYGKTTVDDVAREAGVAKGTVYLHWPTKGAMLHALLEREEQQWNAIIMARMAADPRGGTLSSTYRHALALCMENPMLRALLTQDHDALGEWTRSPQSRARSRRRMEGLHALIGALRAAGLMRTDLSVEVQAYLVAALSYGILTIDEYMPANLVPPFEDVLDAYAVIVQRGLEPELPEAEEAQARAHGQAVIAELISSLADSPAASGQATPQPHRGHATGNGRDAANAAHQERNT